MQINKHIYRVSRGLWCPVCPRKQTMDPMTKNSYFGTLTFWLTSFICKDTSQLSSYSCCFQSTEVQNGTIQKRLKIVFLFPPPRLYNFIHTTRKKYGGWTLQSSFTEGSQGQNSRRPVSKTCKSKSKNREMGTECINLPGRNPIQTMPDQTLIRLLLLLMGPSVHFTVKSNNSKDPF